MVKTIKLWCIPCRKVTKFNIGMDDKDNKNYCKDCGNEFKRGGE